MLESVETEVEEWSTVGRQKTRGEGVERIERGKKRMGEGRETEIERGRE